MKNIIFFNNWGDSPQKVLERYNRQTPLGDGVWGNIRGVSDINSADYFVVFDDFPSEEFYELIPLDKTLFFQREPEEIRKINPYFQNALFFGSYENHHHLSTWQLVDSFVNIQNVNPNKTKLVSTITSSKTYTEGQKQRIKIIKQLSEIIPSKIEIFGKGLSSEVFGPSYKGELNYNGICKIRGLINYNYTLSFENSSHENYFTEKIIDAFLMRTKPIYWGAENIFDFFPREALAYVDIYDENVIDKILNYINEPINYLALEQAKELVLFKYNLWPAIENIITNIQNKSRIFMTEKYYSQIGQDEIIDTELLNKKENGIFVEVGATDGIHFSNTLFFEKFRNWHGLCIEPNPIEFQKLLNSGRNCIKENVAITQSESEAEFLVIDGYGKGLSGIVNNYDQRHISRIEIETKDKDSKKQIVKVKTVPLSKVFEKHNIKKIDYCSIDVEGSEFDVIKSIDFSSVSITCFSIENNYGIEEIKEYLEKRGYIHWKTVQWDELFVHKSFFNNISDNEEKIYSENEIIKVIKPHFVKLLNTRDGATFRYYSPAELINSKRIDPLAKYVYVKFNELNINSNWGKEIYLEHMRSFNQFIEGDDSGKEGIDAFLSSFNSLINSIKQFGFDSSKSVLPISKDKELIEGSHRLGAALFFNIDVPTLSFKNQGWNYDFAFFKNKNLHPKYLDYLALQYLKFNKNLRIVLLFPAAEGKEDEVKKIIASYGDIYYEKEVLFNKSGAELFLTQVYNDEEWLGTIENGFPGAKDKARYCFTGNSSLRVFLFENRSKKNIAEIKEEIRNIYKIDKHSVHINDTFRETELLSNILFNQNSIDFLNTARIKNFENFRRLFSELKEEVITKEIDPEIFCLSGSTTLALLGIREANDLDYISFNDRNLDFTNIKISNHYTEKKYYPTDFDDIIFNPNNYFYFDGIKFASVDVIKKMKLKRSETKDIRDIELLNNLLESNEELIKYLEITEDLLNKQNLDSARSILQYLDVVYSMNPLVKINIAILEYLQGNTNKFYENILTALIINPDNKIAEKNYLSQVSVEYDVRNFKAGIFPLVSVIIPLYNQKEFINESVNSVLEQSYPFWECLIVDDGSTDNSADIVSQIIKNYPDKNIKLLKKENGGLADARNFGIAAANGNFILPLDADDMILPDMLLKTVSVLLADKNISIVGTDTLRFGEKNNSYQTQGLNLETIKYLDTLNYCSLYRKEVWEKIGGYNTNMVFGYEDWNFWISCAEKGFIEKKVPEYLFKYRIREKSMLADANSKKELLLSRIILNHPDIYSEEETRNAKEILSRLNIKSLTHKEKKILEGIYEISWDIR